MWRLVLVGAWRVSTVAVESQERMGLPELLSLVLVYENKYPWY